MPSKRYAPGTTHGRWTITGPLLKKDTNTYAPCRCACGKQKLVNVANLGRGASTQCKECGYASIRGTTRKGTR